MVLVLLRPERAWDRPACSSSQSSWGATVFCLDGAALGCFQWVTRHDNLASFGLKIGTPSLSVTAPSGGFYPPPSSPRSHSAQAIVSESCADGDPIWRRVPRKMNICSKHWRGHIGQRPHAGGRILSLG